MRIKFKSLKRKIIKVPKILAEKSFLFLICLLVGAFLISLFVFWNYSISLKKKEILPYEIKGFNRQKLEKVLEIWQKKKDEFDKVDEKQYQFPF